MAEYTTPSQQSQHRNPKLPPTKAAAATSPQAAATGGERAGGELRETMIREAAYFRAEQRAFAPGNELGDWFDAEREIDAALARRKTDRVRGS